jgi:predicted esterase
MTRILFIFSLVIIGTSPNSAPSQEFKPIPTYPPDAATMQEIQGKQAELKAVVDNLRKSDGMKPGDEESVFRDDYLRPLVEVFGKAAEWTVRLNEFYQKDSAKQTLIVLDEGIRRAKAYPKLFASPSDVAGKALACGYRSVVDRSVQPYVVTFPKTFGKIPGKKWRLDVVLHGRDNTLTEVKLLASALKRGPTKADQDFVQVEVFGRGNNAYRWAGELDVYEARDAAIELVRHLGIEPMPESVDRDRIVLSGFSMGGAGTWHIGLHRPTEWCVIGPGAGFTTTHGYIKNLPAKLPDYQEACLRICDAVDYAENAAMVPVVAYAGDKDPQQQAAINIEEKLKPLGIPMIRLVGTGLAHQFPPEWQKKAQEAYAPFVERGLNSNPKRVHFVTYSLKFPLAGWIMLTDLEKQYEKATVDAEITKDGYRIQTKNVRGFVVPSPPGRGFESEAFCHIDGQKIVIDLRKAFAEETSPLFTGRIGFSKEQGVWKRTAVRQSEFAQSDLDEKTKKGTRKDSWTYGPIDDAFQRSFVCVRGTDNCANQAIQKYTDSAFARFRHEWETYFRGALPEMTDTEFLTKMAAGQGEPGRTGAPPRSLVLFGDPSSNAVIAKLLKEHSSKMPLQWTSKEVVFGGQVYPADTHLPVFIYPNPAMPTRYIVINSGHTFHEADLKGTNALLYPRLGDFAILKPTPTAKDPAAAEVVRAGLFDENWQVPAAK